MEKNGRKREVAPIGSRVQVAVLERFFRLIISLFIGAAAATPTRKKIKPSPRFVSVSVLFSFVFVFHSEPCGTGVDISRTLLESFPLDSAGLITVSCISFGRGASLQVFIGIGDTVQRETRFNFNSKQLEGGTDDSKIVSLFDGTLLWNFVIRSEPIGLYPHFISSLLERWRPAGGLWLSVRWNFCFKNENCEPVLKLLAERRSGCWVDQSSFRVELFSNGKIQTNDRIKFLPALIRRGGLRKRKVAIKRFWVEIKRRSCCSGTLPHRACSSAIRRPDQFRTQLLSFVPFSMSVRLSRLLLFLLPYLDRWINRNFNWICCCCFVVSFWFLLRWIFSSCVWFSAFS